MSGLDDHDVIRLIHDADLNGLLDRLGDLDVPTDWNWWDNYSSYTPSYSLIVTTDFMEIKI